MLIVYFTLSFFIKCLYNTYLLIVKKTIITHYVKFATSSLHLAKYKYFLTIFNIIERNKKPYLCIFHV
jgi:hypothetical protein